MNQQTTDAGRRIPAIQAHQIALRNLHRAEAERRSLAEEEARRGINWEGELVRRYKLILEWWEE